MAVANTWTPRLGLDLRGGTTITLTARNSTGSGSVSPDSLELARTIIQQRVDGLGVGEAEVATQGTEHIVVTVPNVQQDELVRLVGRTAQLAFRNVFAVDYAAVQPTATPSPTASGSASAVPASTPSASASAQAPSATPSRKVLPGLPTAPPAPTTPRPTVEASVMPSTDELMAWTPSEQDAAEFAEFQCGDPFPDVADQPLFACDQAGQVKYLLGPKIISGDQVTDAQAGVPQGQLAYVVTLSFNSSGADAFLAATTKLSQQSSPMNQFAIVLDSEVISAPVPNGPIPGGNAEISGSFDAASAQELANVLKYGALPLAFDVSSVENVSATLGGEQLRAGLIAGLIGLLLVIAYAFLYYRGLGLVVVGSLGVAGLFTYATMTLLGESMGFALNLPGIAGAIVAIGITADSFVIYFERIRDEIRDGRTLRTAIETGWAKARSTIVIADMVSLLSALVLFFLAIGGVKGFAFTLGLTTLIDLMIVFFFTKPLMSVLGRTAFFGEGHKWSGLEAEHMGVSRDSLLGRRGRSVGTRKPTVASKEA
ncbi:MAG TPA: protein translocase subunit SecD [Propionibacteriaceae bacterium]|nr:protein translocase subunit SecD [Propionibacteriaceae bacterium]